MGLVDLRMWGFPPSMKAWEDFISPVLRGSRVALKGCETDDMLPMSPEGAEIDVHQGRCLLTFADIC